MATDRERIISEINQYFDAISDNKKLIDTIKKKLENETLTQTEQSDFHSEIETLEDENKDYRIDIAMLEEVLHKMDIEDTDDLTYDTQEERYDSWDEVFTGGDY